MTALTRIDPFAPTHEDIAEQLEPFCDDYLDRFSDQELLSAYDLATAWSDELAIAQTAAASIAGEWQVRYRRSLPRVGTGLISGQGGSLAAQFDRTYGWLLAA